TRLKRVTESRDWSKQDLQEREAAQLPLDKKQKKADYIVNNEGNLDAVHAQVSEILEEIRRQS
ncbi:MAG: dephospho-CoA kinase, partial [Phycisphaerae bacterium]|nr:dephospho-CoA kinase [Phycisphaerae bacterium]